MTNCRYYVYILIDPRSATPFYVGKGSKRRAYDHVRMVKNGKKSANPFKDAVIKKILSLGVEPEICFFAEYIEENDAYDMEEQLIRQFGRRITDENGLLTNICESSRPPGLPLGYKHSEETKQKIRESRLGEKNPMFGQVPWNKGLVGEFQHTDDVKEIIGARVRGKTFEELYGEEKAWFLRSNASQRLKGRTLDEILGPEKATKQKEQIREKLANKTLEEILGDENAAKGRQSRRENYQLQEHQFEKGQVPWNKGQRKVIDPEEKRQKNREALQRWRDKKRGGPPRELLTEEEKRRRATERNRKWRQRKMGMISSPPGD